MPKTSYYRLPVLSSNRKWTVFSKNVIFRKTSFLMPNEKVDFFFQFSKTSNNLGISSESSHNFFDARLLNWKYWKNVKFSFSNVLFRLYLFWTWECENRIAYFYGLVLGLGWSITLVWSFIIITWLLRVRLNRILELF